MKLLSGPQFSELQESLLSAFPSRPNLEQMMRIGLDTNLNNISAGENLSEDVYRLIIWAESTGQLDKLLIAAADQNPENVRLSKFVNEYKEHQHKFDRIDSTLAGNISHSKLRVFLCHAKTDKAEVHRLYQQLKSDGIEPWLDEENLLPGQNWEIVIPNEVRNSDVVLVCLSKESVSRDGYVQDEIRLALSAATLKPEEIYLIPAKLEECDVPAPLTSWQWVDLFESSGYEKLIRSLQKRAEQLELLQPILTGSYVANQNRTSIWKIYYYIGIFLALFIIMIILLSPGPRFFVGTIAQFSQNIFTQPTTETTEQPTGSDFPSNTLIITNAHEANVTPVSIPETEVALNPTSTITSTSLSVGTIPTTTYQSSIRLNAPTPSHTSYPLNTPERFRTDTLSPAHAPTLTPAGERLNVPKSTPTPFQIMANLLVPEDGIEVKERVTFSWQVPMEPPPGAKYQLAFWQNEPHQAFGINEAILATEFTGSINLGALGNQGNLKPGTYQWGVCLWNEKEELLTSTRRLK
ncbi:MAG: toll/interleukin-1 receptor domain-containing protein [Chloroflexota bacterium]